MELACAVDPAKKAVLDEAHRVFVDSETYYVSNAEARAAFLREPWRYTGLVTDPVSHERFQPDGKSPRAQHAGRLFLFASRGSADRFAADPDEYALPFVPYAGNMGGNGH